MPEPILSVNNLTVRLDEHDILTDVSFDLFRGESLAIIGPNGAGKSILLKAILGLIPYRGTIEQAPNARVGYVPQKIDADRHLPINFHNLLLAEASVLKLNPNKVSEIIKTVGLDETILQTPVGHLSGGEFQRALIALALLSQPTILILDEPTASIDRPGEEHFYELIHRLHQTHKLTIILVSHDLSFVYRYANKVLCLNQKNICFGKPEQALTPEVLKQLYGGPMQYYHSAHNHNAR